jgi:hypothetical protein
VGVEVAEADEDLEIARAGGGVLEELRRLADDDLRGRVNDVVPEYRRTAAVTSSGDIVSSIAA